MKVIGALGAIVLLSGCVATTTNSVGSTQYECSNQHSTGLGAFGAIAGSLIGDGNDIADAVVGGVIGGVLGGVADNVNCNNARNKAVSKELEKQNKERERNLRLMEESRKGTVYSNGESYKLEIANNGNVFLNHKHLKKHKIKEVSKFGNWKYRFKYNNEYYTAYLIKTKYGNKLSNFYETLIDKQEEEAKEAKERKAKEEARKIAEERKRVKEENEAKERKAREEARKRAIERKRVKEENERRERERKERENGPQRDVYEEE